MRKRTLVLIFSSLSASYLGYDYLAPEMPLSEIRYDQASRADYYIEEVTIKQFDSQGNLSSRLTADKLEHFKRGDESLIQSPVVEMQNPDLSVWQLTAERGQLSHADNQLFLKDKVLITQQAKPQQQTEGSQTVATQGAALSQIATDNLSLALTEKTAQTQSQVTIDSAGVTTHAATMFADFNQQLIELEGGVDTQGKSQ